MEVKFYICEHCGNVVMKVCDKGVPVMCCGQRMTELIPNVTDAAAEKHVPVAVSASYPTGSVLEVTVGSAEHPMTAEHFIEWIAVKTKQGVQIKHLKAGDRPTAVFSLCGGDRAEEVYALCNLHGLWKAECPD